MKLRSQCAICLVAGVGLFAACGDDEGGPSGSSTGGAGGALSSGGAKATGGLSATGGSKATGGAGGGPGSGGVGNGGTSSGGASSGGTSSGGAASGGASSGGAASGGASSGGAASGGASSGGAASGGAASGGAASGGAASGGASSGGASSGGAASGGASSGGASTDAGDGDASTDPDSGGPTGGIVINELESSGGVPGDWIELYNSSNAAIDVSGWIVRDVDDNSYTLPSGTTIAAGAFLVLEQDGLGFGLGSPEQVQLFNGTTVVDSYIWTSHAAGTYRRCPDGTGAFVNGSGAGTKGAANSCQ